MANPDPPLPTIKSACGATSAYTDAAVSTGKQTNPTGLPVQAAPTRPNNGLGSPGYDPSAVNGAPGGVIDTTGTPGPIDPGEGNNN